MYIMNIQHSIYVYGVARVNQNRPTCGNNLNHQLIRLVLGNMTLIGMSTSNNTNQSSLCLSLELSSIRLIIEL